MCQILNIGIRHPKDGKACSKFNKLKSDDERVKTYTNKES